jgi:hypothetical protein
MKVKKNISVTDEKGGNSTEEQPAGTDYDHLNRVILNKMNSVNLFRQY